MSWWGQFWARVLGWVLVTDAPRVHGGNLCFLPPVSCRLSLEQKPPRVRWSGRPHCRVNTARAPTRSCTVRCIPPIEARGRDLCAPVLSVQVRSWSVQSACRVRKLLLAHATQLVSHRVLLSRRTVVVTACVSPRDGLARTRAAKLRWRCRVQQATIRRFRTRALRSSQVWRLPIARYAVPFEQLSAEYRRQCREALQRAAKGYARVQSVYYPVPAHAVARIEIDERLGVLYAHPRSERTDGDAVCLWVVWGVRVSDGRRVRALFRVG